jgi:hypothetical protein
MPDNLVQGRYLEVFTGKFRFSAGNEGGGEPGDRGGGRHQEPEVQEDLHQDVEIV